MFDVGREMESAWMEITGCRGWNCRAVPRVPWQEFTIGGVNGFDGSVRSIQCVLEYTFRVWFCSVLCRLKYRSGGRQN